MQRNSILILGVWLGAMVGCSAGPPSGLEGREQANFVNGDFESGNLTGWTVTTHTNRNIATLPPNDIGDLDLRTGGTNNTKVVMGNTAESVLAAGLQTGDTLMYPRFGRYSAVVNELGSNYNSNELTQSMTTTAADVDPQDGNIHVRFVLAPVLQNPGHAANQQPYFYLELRNTTKNQLLFSSFNFSGQPGIPYKNSGGGSVQYTDWQLFDVVPGAANLAVGDTVVLDVIASGCGAGGHWGHVYVDGFGSFIPSLTVAATAPAMAGAGTNITYNYVVTNGSTLTANGVVVNEVLPAGTTFVSVAGATCNTPAVGGTGTVSCMLGTLNASGTTSFQITVNINSNATGSISNGNYTVQGTGISALIGPLVTTVVLPTYLITANVTGGNGTIVCQSPVVAGSSSVCTITPAVGYGLATLTLDGADVLAGVNGSTYTLMNVNAAHTLQGSFGAVARYNISATVPGGNGTVTCQSPVTLGASSVCTITPATGYALSALTLDATNVLAAVNGNFYTITNVTASHTVQAAFAPAMYVITTNVLGGNGTLTCMNPLTRGANSVCTITPNTGYALSYLYLDGNDVSAGVIGNMYTITNVTAGHLVQAIFAKAEYTITASVGAGSGTLSCQSPVLYGASAVCTITPAAGYVLSGLTRDGMDVLAAVTGNVYTLGNVTAPHTVQAVFAPAMYNINTAVPGGNGTVSCTGPLASGMSSVCTITPATGYGLATLTLDGNNVIGSVTGNTYTIANVTAPHLVQATFSQSVFAIMASAPAGNGTIVCQSPVVNGTSSICTITPATGFVLSALTLDGNDDLAGVNGNSYMIPNVTTTHAVVAAFAPAAFTISAAVPGGNGTVMCTSPVTYGGTASCAFTPASGYALAGLTLDGTDVLSRVVANTLTLANITASHVVQANFVQAPYVIAASVAGGNGQITCASPILHGQTAVCQIIPAVGYWLQALTEDGNDVLGQVSGNSLAIPSVTANHTVVGTFAPSTYLITVSVPGGNGTISCPPPISQGGTGTCTIAAATGYLLGTLTLDGNDVLSQVMTNTLTINNVTAPHLLQGTFVQTINIITVNIPGGNGTIACTNPILYGQGSVCQIIPAAGYRLGSLSLDGEDIIANVVGNSFVISSITAPRTIQAAFVQIPKYDITVNILGGNGTITCTTPVAQGQTASCSIAPAAGYTLDTLTLDGQDSRLLVQGTGFSLYNVTAPHTVAGTFKRAGSNACLSAADCKSGFCTDGVCCDRACNGQCEACDVSGSVGTCAPILGTPRAGHPTCGEFLCAEQGCMTTCSSDDECVAGAVCSAGTCRQGERAIVGGGVYGCTTTTTGSRSSSGAAAFTFFALLALGLMRRRAAYRAG